jgi:signal transduction histidine kinase
MSKGGLSLERKLPLVAAAVLVGVLGLYTYIAYRAVAKSAEAAVSERVIRVAAELARSTATSAAARARQVDSLVNQAAVRTALRDRAYARLDTLLRVLRQPGDSSLDITVYDSARRPVHFLGQLPDREISSRIEPELAAAERLRRAVNSAPSEYQGRAHYWVTAAVRDAEGALGYVAQLREIRATPAAARTLNALVGGGGSILFASAGDPTGRWITLEGGLLRAPEQLAREGGSLRYRRDGRWYLGALDSIVGTSFAIVVEAPASAAQAGARQFLAGVAALGLILLLVAVVAAWLLSRRFTRPIHELSEAAAGIARGEYGRRVEVRRTDEIGTLASAFNRMAGEVQGALRIAEESRAEAEQANRTKSGFLASMSHEIRTPINAILGYADLMEAGVSGPLTERQREQIGRIRLSGRHLVGLIDDLLDFARIEGARLTVEQRPQFAADAVDTALTVVMPAAEAKRIRIDSAIPPDVQYLGDSKRVEQILVNLLGNAVKFTPDGGRVEVTCRMVAGGNGQGSKPAGPGDHGGRATEFVVADTGIGIPEAQLASIFEPFVQAHNGYTRPHGGTGLGLAISRRLTELMNGTLAVTSLEGAGSSFVLTLPAP